MSFNAAAVTEWRVKTGGQKGGQRGGEKGGQSLPRNGGWVGRRGQKAATSRETRVKSTGQKTSKSFGGAC